MHNTLTIDHWEYQLMARSFQNFESESAQVLNIMSGDIRSKVLQRF